MTTERIKGQEYTTIIVLNSQVQDTLTCVSDFEGEVTLEVLKKGYLGERTDRTDMVMKGAKFNYGLDTFTQDWITFVQAIQAKAQRTAPNTQINISGVFEYTNGDTPSILFGNCSFGPIPFKAGARNQFIGKKFTGECDSPVWNKS